MNARRTIASLLLVFATGLSNPAMAADEMESEAERLLGEGLEKMFEGLDLLMKTVPQYSAPEMLPNGDIIIRRIPQGDGEGPHPAPGPEPLPPDPDSTET